MNIRDVLYMRNTGKLLPRASIQDKLLARKLSGGGVITTATGNPVSIITSKAQNAISTLLSYSPKQSGSGTPSPQNIRPIEGWTEYDLTVNENRITESIGGTYYGFTVDLENGTLTIDMEKNIIDENSDIMLRNSGVFMAQLAHPYLKLRVTGAKKGMCDRLNLINKAGLDSPDYGEINCLNNSGNDTYQNVTFKIDSTIDTVEKLKIWLEDNPITVVSNLAEPLTYNLTPQTVALLKGNNTLATDGDSITITYVAPK